MATVARLKVLMEADSHKLTSALHRAKQAVFSVKNAVGLLAGAGGLGALVTSQLNAADETGKFAKRIGISVEALSELRHAAKLSGVQTNTLNTALQRMVKRIGQVAATGKGEAKSALERLGVDADKLKNMKPDEMLGAIADGMKNIATQGEKVATMAQIFDSEGVALLQMMEGGAEGVEKMRKSLRDIGGTLTKEGAEKAAKAIEAMDMLKASIGGVAQALAVNLADEMELFFKGLMWGLTRGIAAFKTLGEMIGASIATWAAIFRGDFSGAGAIVSDFSLADTFRKNLGEAAITTAPVSGPRAAYDPYGNDAGLDKLGTLPEMTARMTGEAFQKALDNMTLVKVAG